MQTVLSTYSILIGYIKKIFSVRRNEGRLAFLNVHGKTQKTAIADETERCNCDFVYLYAGILTFNTLILK